MVEARVAKKEVEVASVAKSLWKVEVALEVAVNQPMFKRGKLDEAVHVLALPKLSEATTAPAVGAMVRVPSALETEETPPTQVPPMAKQPALTLIPCEKVEVAVVERLIAVVVSPRESKVPGELEAIPTLPVVLASKVCPETVS